MKMIQLNDFHTRIFLNEAEESRVPFVLVNTGHEEDEALFETLRANIGPKVELVEMDNNVNDDAFAVAAAQKLLDLLES